MGKIYTEIQEELTIEAPVDLVWHAWTLSDRVSQWFAPEATIEAKEGGKYELYFIPGNELNMNTKGCKVIRLIPEQELVFQWKGPDQFNPLMNNNDELTTVSIRFEKMDAETKVLLRHDGFKEGTAWSEALQWHQMAWSGVLKSLKNALEKGKGELCCQPE
ncbi:SRPBCC family protein [Mesobacillus subterraneus]|uniref:SRPBCC domain-containing protein n=1 Tax=Mesobacillus subterraneus TaxID=285983 RepID=A0A3R9DWL0_9BACI|nr:SRPBCC domain-containing protein [Mesobacillus subterraneus]RSD29040.1 SRPBCC domain-containing protein [Mesobacillus subterraneus]